ncbi:MAG: proline--tRNA ligase [Candidatus Aenigmarchaeota archaeon]|nr:proline--tRNA ligase [Candidatus Aenigmarchaeota archaeon]
MAEQEGLTVKKADNFSEWYTQVVEKAELSDIRYNVKGFVVFRPWAVMSMELMYDALERELQAKGHKPVWFPAVIPESNFSKEAEHVKGFAAEVFWITEAGSQNEKLEERLALRPTSETAMYGMYSLWIRSWRDLPLKLYQRGQVWRYEGKATRPFIRSREFYWIESHDVFATRGEAEAQVTEDMETTRATVHDKFGVPFLFFQRPEHDKFAGAIHTYAADTIMPDGRVLQLPSTHLLSQDFAKSFGVKFKDKDEKEQYVWQTCYGPAVSRIFAAVVSAHGDDKGLIIPPEIAPTQIVIVPIHNDQTRDAVLVEARKIKADLEKRGGFRVELDERDGYTPGWKFNYWELKGVPLRIEIGPRDIEAKQVVMVRRDTGEKKGVPVAKAFVLAKAALRNVQRELTKRADKGFKQQMRKATTMRALKEILREKGGMVKVAWCGEADCADMIRAETDGGTVRGTLLGEKQADLAGRKCVYCKKPAAAEVYVARQY